MWESRHGFPVPERTPSGHRRYTVQQVAALQEVLRLRSDGLSLRAAIDRIARAVPPPEPSVFSMLRDTTGLPPQTFAKPALLRMSRAIEDECVLGPRPVALVAGFQHERFLRQSLPRFRDLARTVDACVLFAEDAAPAEGPPAVVPLDCGDPLVREWFLAGWSAECAVALAGWERPGAECPDAERVWECVWTVSRDAAREVLEWAAHRTEQHVPAAAGALREALEPGGARGDGELRALERIGARMLRYVAGCDG